MKKIDFMPRSGEQYHLVKVRVGDGFEEKILERAPKHLAKEPRVVCENGPYTVTETYDAPSPIARPVWRAVLCPDGATRTLTLGWWWPRYSVTTERDRRNGGVLHGNVLFPKACRDIARAVELLAEWGAAPGDYEDQVDAYMTACRSMGDIVAWCLASADAVDLVAARRRSESWYLSPKEHALVEHGAVFHRRKDMYEAASHLPAGRYRAWRVRVYDLDPQCNIAAVAASDAASLFTLSERKDGYGESGPWIDIEVK